MKALLLIRASNDEYQPSAVQEQRLRDYAEQKTLIIDQVYEIPKASAKPFYNISKSSSKHIRKEFKQVLKEIQNSEETIALVVDSIYLVEDSFREVVVLEDLRKQGKVEIHFLQEELILNLNSSPSDLTRWHLGVLFARSMTFN